MGITQTHVLRTSVRILLQTRATKKPGSLVGPMRIKKKRRVGRSVSVDLVRPKRDLRILAAAWEIIAAHKTKNAPA